MADKYSPPIFQPVVFVDGIIRFRENPLVRYLLDQARRGRKCDLNDLAALPNVDARDMEQLNMLIGYSVSGFGDLDYVRPETLARADTAAVKLRRKGDGEVLP